MKFMKTLFTVVIALTLTVGMAAAQTSSTSTNNITSSLTTNGGDSMSVGAVGGANPCAEGVGVAVAGFGGTVTTSAAWCVANLEAQAIAVYCPMGPSGIVVTPSCVHLARNNPDIRATLTAIGAIQAPQQAAVSTRAVSPAPQTNLPQGQPQTLRVQYQNGHLGTLRNAANIAAVLSALESGQAIRTPDGRMIVALAN